MRSLSLPPNVAQNTHQTWCTLPSMCIFDKFSLTFNFKSKLPHGIFKNKNAYLWTSTYPSKKFTSMSHGPVVRVISISKVSIDVWFFVSTNQTTCQNLSCACRLTCILFLWKFLRVNRQKLAKTLSKIHTDCRPPQAALLPKHIEKCNYLHIVFAFGVFWPRFHQVWIGHTTT
jgi:hypothetical protein